MFGCLFGLIRRVGCLILLVALAFAGYQWLVWPDVAEIEIRDPRSTAFIDRYREAHGQTAALHWEWVSYDRISKELMVAVLVGEDIDFFSHGGFAVGEFQTAFKDSVLEGKALRGASTISQQTVKNLYLSASRNPWRKIKEAILTLQLEREIPKHRILEVYLNVAEFAPGVYGAEAASLRRYGRSASSLSKRQAAELAACLPSPTKCGAQGGDSFYERRVDRIERRAAKADWLEAEL